MKVKELLQKKPYISVGYCFILVNDGSTLENLENYYRKYRKKTYSDL